MKTYIVTGSSGGIGKAICETLIQRKIKVVGIARSEAPHHFDKNFYRSYKVDFSNLQLLSKKMARVINDCDRLDGMISCVGVGNFGSIENFSLDQIEQSLRINLISHIAVTKFVLPVLKRQKKGDLIFFGSESALKGGKQGSLYSAAKFGLRGFTQSIRAEIGDRDIKVVLINPGMVKTKFFKDLSFEPGRRKENTIQTADLAAFVLHLIEMGRSMNIDEISINPMVKSVVKKSIA